MLHLIFQSPLQDSLLARINNGDAVVLQGKACWSLLQGHFMAESLQALLTRACRLYVLRDDLQINGIEESRLLPGVTVIDYSGLVELTVDNAVNKTWR